MQPTATLSPTPDTMAAAGLGPDDMLRTAVERIREEGWESAWAAWLFEQLQARCGAWAAKVD